MNEIYWITRLTAINTLFKVMMIIALIGCGITLILYIVNRCDEINATEGSAYQKESSLYKKLCSRLLKWFSTFAIMGVLGILFIPTTKEALLIYGVGGTIDYVKQNPVAKQIPDKCIVALDKWVESLTKEAKEDKKKEEKDD